MVQYRVQGVPITQKHNFGPLSGVSQMCGDRSKCTIVPDTQLSGCVSSINTFIVGETMGLLLKFWLNLDSIFRSVVWIV